jgi:hypothetical protein
VKIPCPKCKTALRQQVSVYVDAPAGCTSLNKKGLAKRAVKILGVGWGYATWYCPRPGCGHFQHFAPYIRDGRLDFTPGVRVRFVNDPQKTGVIARVTHTKYTTCWIDLDGGGRQRATSQHLELLPKDK